MNSSAATPFVRIAQKKAANGFPALFKAMSMQEIPSAGQPF